MGHDLPSGPRAGPHCVDHPRCPARRSPLGAPLVTVGEPYHNPAAVWAGALRLPSSSAIRRWPQSAEGFRSTLAAARRWRSWHVAAQVAAAVAGAMAVAPIVAGDSALPEVARVPAFAGAFAGACRLTLRAELKLRAHDSVPNKKSQYSSGDLPRRPTLRGRPPFCLLRALPDLKSH
jgi:hypothetical protein